MPDSSKPKRRPRWWLNTYFIFGFILTVIAVLGFVNGSGFIRDPGQPEDSSLAMWYLFAAALFFISGFVSHQATVNQYAESQSE